MTPRRSRRGTPAPASPRTPAPASGRVLARAPPPRRRTRRAPVHERPPGPGARGVGRRGSYAVRRPLQRARPAVPADHGAAAAGATTIDGPTGGVDRLRPVVGGELRCRRARRRLPGGPAPRGRPGPRRTMPSAPSTTFTASTVAGWSSGASAVPRRLPRPRPPSPRRPASARREPGHHRRVLDDHEPRSVRGPVPRRDPAVVDQPLRHEGWNGRSADRLIKLQVEQRHAVARRERGVELFDKAGGGAPGNRRSRRVRAGQHRRAPAQGRCGVVRCGARGEHKLTRRAAGWRALRRPPLPATGRRLREVMLIAKHEITPRSSTTSHHSAGRHRHRGRGSAPRRARLPASRAIGSAIEVCVLRCRPAGARRARLRGKARRHVVGRPRRVLQAHHLAGHAEEFGERPLRGLLPQRASARPGLV